MGSATVRTREPQKDVDGSSRQFTTGLSRATLLSQGCSVSGRAISDYALISDCRSAALVSIDGSIDWLCFPDFDSESVFARLLDSLAGHWLVSVRETIEVKRRYLKESMVLETTFVTSRGVGVATIPYTPVVPAVRKMAFPGTNKTTVVPLRELKIVIFAPMRAARSRMPVKP